MNKKIFLLLFVWAIFLFLGILLFQFLHECGHGFGSRLGGTHVSTGFNRVGDVGKRPCDPDFRTEHLIEGTMDSASLLGPFLNWMFAILFTAILLQRKRADRLALFFGAGALANAFMRFVPMLGFFFNALAGRFVIEDEASWGLISIKGLNFPLAYSDFRALVSSQPSLFLSEPKIYFWPALSFIISFACLILAYRRLSALFRSPLRSRPALWLFGLMPVLVWPFTFFLSNRLDNLIRINW